MIDDDSEELTLGERIVVMLVPWRLRSWFYRGRSFVAYWLTVAWWTWKTRKLPKTEITLVHPDDATYFWPGQVVGTSTGDGKPLDLTRLVRIDSKRGVLICALEAGR